MAKSRANGEGTIFQREDGRYSTQLYVTLPDSTRKRICITKKTRAEVVQKRLELLTQESKSIPFTQKNWTVEEYLDYWQELNIDRICETTYKSYEVLIRLYLKPLLGKKKLNALGVRDVQMALAGLKKMGKSGNRGQQFLKTLRACLNHAMREEIIFRNVAALAEKPKHTAKPTDIWTIEQCKHFLEFHIEHYLCPYFLLLIVYGMRKCEGLGIRWSDIDFEKNIIHVRQQVDKINGVFKARELKTANSSRNLPLIPVVKKALLGYAKQKNITIPPCNPNREMTINDIVCTTSTNTLIDPRNLNRAFNGMTKKAGLPKIKIHALRHTAATVLKDLKTPTKDIQLALGHAHISTTERLYIHGNVKSCTKGFKALGTALFSNVIET